MNMELLMMDMGRGANVPQITKGWRHVFEVREFECMLLYRFGKFVQQLGPGRQVRWGKGWGWKKVDLRRRTLPVSGQEVLTSDGVAVKISLAVRFRVVDPLKAMHEDQDWMGQVYTCAQLALRKEVSAQTVEALLANRLDIGQQVLTQLNEQAAPLGIEIIKTEVKDVMFPGEVKKVFTEVLRARQEGQAALERARGESAALRNLANAARLLENNPALQNLRLMQSISATGNTLVMGVPAGFVPLRNGQTAPNGSTTEGNPKG
ncbi:MAG: hypothetical protein RI897_1063 [Verrucomicrobiota bacterium]|jgi:regulator of protease activity HflC (stomatin/prohibitin superfamily)